MIGRTLSHFKIVSRIGEGGMGVVYRAEDEKLHRPVALKVLPPDAVADEERRLRFLREARAAASLSHPNIATIHEVDEADGIIFIAMEFIEGKTLRSALRGKPLSIRESLRIGIEIAEGLAKAHHARVVHRDLKPENVMVTVDGHVKILDFGLAKLLERDEELSADEASRLETISGEMTKQGRILGTAAYMSPEQARGQSVDSRSDLFAFGIVLYEMVTGRAPFHGPTPMDTLSAILKSSVAPANQINEEVPQELERILGKCLEKDPSERYQDTRDLAVDLKRLKRDTESQPLTRPASGPVATAQSGPITTPDRMVTPSPAATAAVGTGTAGDRGSTSPVRAGSVSPAAGSAASPAHPPGSAGSEWSAGGQRDPTVSGSPRGQADSVVAGSAGSQAVPTFAAGLKRFRIIFIAAGTLTALAGLAWIGWRIWPPRQPQQVQGQLRQRQVFSGPASGGKVAVSISPDGKYLAVGEPSGLSVRKLESGEVRHIPMPNGQTARGVAWTIDSTNLLVTGMNSSEQDSIWSIPLVTGEPRLLHGVSSGHPVASPDGDLVAFEVWGSEPYEEELWVMDPQGGSARRVLAFPKGKSSLHHFAWSPDGRRIAYLISRWGSEKGGEQNIESLGVDGGSTTSIISDPLLQLAHAGGGGLRWLPDGRLFFSLSEPPPNIVDANIWSLQVDPLTGIPKGKPERITNWAGGRPGVVGASKDGRVLLVARDQLQSDVWVGELDEGGTRLKTPRPLAPDYHSDRPSFWMPDSRRVVFSSDRNGSVDLLVQDVTGGDALPLVVGPGETSEGVLLPEKNTFLFTETPTGEKSPKEVTVKRADLSGTSVETLFKLPATMWGDCPSNPDASCVLGEVLGKEAVFYEMELMKGRGKVISRLPTPENFPVINCSLSRDGLRLACLGVWGSGIVNIVTLADGTTSEMRIKDHTNLQSVVWAPDGKGLFLSEQFVKSSILHVDLQGHIHVLLASLTGGEWLSAPLPSPDGHYLAYQSVDVRSDYWLLEGF